MSAAKIPEDAMPYEEAICCFCGDGVPFRTAPLLVLYSSILSIDSDGVSQNLFTHANCLRDRVIGDIGLITEFPQ